MSCFVRNGFYLVSNFEAVGSPKLNLSGMKERREERGEERRRREERGG